MHILEIGADQQDEDGGSARIAEAAFRTVPREHTTFLVWRITESSTELLPRNHYGTFYDGEAYLVYSCSMPGQPAGPDVIRREVKENGNAEYAERHIHAWAGERSGALAALALRRGTQLAAYLGAPAVIHRESSTKESPRLLSYFRDGIRILRSGCGAGGARLYRVRGRRPVLLQLEPVSWAQLAADGVFVLDTAALLVLWLGRAANLIEKMFGAKIAYRMARGADKGMTARRIAIAHDGYEQTLPPADRALLDALLELRARAVRPAAPPADPPRAARLYRATQPPRTAATAATLPALAAQRPAARLEEVKRAPLMRDDLTDDGVYIVDSGSRGVWAWVGASASAAAARGALAAARGLARARRLAAPVSAAPAGREPLEFAALFRDWRWGDKRRDVRVRVARSATTRLDAVSLASNAWLAAEAQLPDDGSGALRVWRVGRGGAGAELERPQAAAFYDGDCYIALYTYHAPTGDHSILYYWMGGSSPNDLRNLGAKEAKDLYVKLGRLPVQAWIYQGKEPAHFLQIFKGRMITYVGSATDYDRAEKAEFWSAVGPRRALLVAAPRQPERALPPRLFYAALGAPGQYSFEEIISFSQYDLAPETAALLDAHASVFVWLGAHCCQRARDDALKLAEAYLAQDPAARDPETPVLVVGQGREPPHFTGFFPHWKQSMWKGHKTFSAIISALEGKAIVRGGNSALQTGNSAYRFDQYEKYPLAILRGPKEHLPSDVDPLAKELYLTHDDFVSTFQMPYSEFRSLPGWKQKDLKKSVGLF